MRRALFVRSDTGDSDEALGSLSMCAQWRGESVVFLGSPQLQLNKSFVAILSSQWLALKSSGALDVLGPTRATLTEPAS